MSNYLEYVKKTKHTVVYPPGWSVVNKTGTWRSMKPVIDQDRCTRCGLCWIYCPDGAVIKKEDRFEINYDYCKGCGICMEECKRRAIEMVREEE